MKNSRSFVPVFFSMISCLLIVSCKKTVINPPDIAKAIVLPENGNSVVQANNEFAFNFLRSVMENDKTSTNKLISPLSIHMALSMVYNGAANSTKDSMQGALQLNTISTGDLNNTYRSAIEQIPAADNKITLSIANSIWYRQEIQPVPGFLDIVNNYYEALISPLNFNNASSVDTINQWVSEKTKGKIPEVLKKIDPNDLMFLINAIYFKGDWKHQFDKNDTRNDAFYTDNNSPVSAPFMYLKDTINYFANDSLQMIQLPYGAGNFNMYILLPEDNIRLDDLASHITAPSLQNWQRNSHLENFELYFPKFRYSYSIDDMRQELAALGMDIAFTDYADFSNMYSVPVEITKAVHKTYIEVNEQGTEAAAVTSIGISETAIPVPNVVKVNHPFIYLIQEKTSGFILFVGVVYDPTLQ